MSKKSVAGQYRHDDSRVSGDLLEMDHDGSGKYWHRKPVEDEDNFDPYSEEFDLCIEKEEDDE